MTTSTTKQNPRQIAFLTLRDIHKGGFADVILDRFLQSSKLPDIDRLILHLALWYVKAPNSGYNY